MKYLWIGEYPNQGLDSRLNSAGYRAMSIRVAQNSIISGLKKCITLDSISGCRLPFNKKSLIFRGEEWIEGDGSVHYFVDLITIPYLEILIKTLNIRKVARKWSSQHVKDNCVVIVYGMHSPYFVAVSVIRKYVSNLTTVLIVPDLPEYYDFNMSPLKRILKWFDVKAMYASLSMFNRYVIFSENMAEKLNLTRDNYMVMEGSIESVAGNTLLEVANDAEAEDGKKRIVYTGSINEGYGIDILLRTFSCLRGEEFVLEIAGSGTEESRIKEYMKSDKRVVFHGYISDKTRLREIQRKAMVLMCMIPTSNLATKYCFPSKLFEYMMSGNPTMSFKLDGMPREYFDYLIIMNSEDPTAIAAQIESISLLTPKERRDIGSRAAQFVFNKKNSYTQAKRIINFANFGEES